MIKASSMLYEKETELKERYLLGSRGKKTLVCIGINPSTAIPGKLDKTLTRVDRITMTRGYDSWMMLNVYPHIATNPDELDQKFRTDRHCRNMQTIKEYLSGTHSDIWAAWGVLINKRPYLPKCLFDITQILGTNANWLSMGNLTKYGHPRHPLYLKGSLPLIPFDIGDYIEQAL